MTPFDTWYAAKIAPTIPNDAPDIVKKISREMMAACWDSALETVCGTKFMREEFPIAAVLPREVREQIRALKAAEDLQARVSA